MSTVNQLLGQTLRSIDVSNSKDEIIFETVSGRKYRMYHFQDCCENVYVEDVVGNLSDLIGYPLLMAEEAVSRNEDPENYVEKEEDMYRVSYTWTFYKFATVKGYVTIRWYGTSNGYYSESVDFEEI